MAPKKQHSSAETIKKRNRPTDQTPMEVAGSCKNPGGDQAGRRSDMISLDPTLGSFGNPNYSVAKSAPPRVSSLPKASRSKKRDPDPNKRPIHDHQGLFLVGKSVTLHKKPDQEDTEKKDNDPDPNKRPIHDHQGLFLVGKSVTLHKKPDQEDTEKKDNVEGLTAKGSKSKDDGKAKQGKSKLPSRNKPVSKNKVNICPYQPIYQLVEKDEKDSLYYSSSSSLENFGKELDREYHQMCLARKAAQARRQQSKYQEGVKNKKGTPAKIKRGTPAKINRGTPAKINGGTPAKIKRGTPVENELCVESRPGYNEMSEKVMGVYHSVKEIDSGHRHRSLFARRNPTFEEIWEREFGVPYPVRKPDSKTAGLGRHRKKLERIVTPCIQDPKDSQLNRLSGLTRATEHSRQGMELSSLKRLNRLSGLTRATEHSRQGMELSSLKRFPPVPESTELPPPLSKPQTAEFPPVPESTELPPPLSKPQTAEIPHVPESTELPPPLLKSQVAKPNELSSLPKSTKLSRQRMKLASLKRFLPAPEIAQFPPPVTKSQMDMRMGSPGRPKSTKLSRQRMELAPFKLVAAEETTCASRSIFADCTPVSTTRTPRRFKADSVPQPLHPLNAPLILHHSAVKPSSQSGNVPAKTPKKAQPVRNSMTMWGAPGRTPGRHKC